MTGSWWQTAVFYCADVETFADGDGDGVGDMVGMVDHLDHLVELGVDALWLLPINPSPNRDDGYDVVDYYAVDPRLGTLDLFRTLVGAAHERGVRVVLDLPLNHTSDLHPWFRAATQDPDSHYGRYYVWSDHEPDTPASSVFPDEVPSPWSRHETAGRWYLHHFYPSQPDLDTGNPHVWARLRDTVGFWLDQGVDGVRVDAAPFLIGRQGPPTGRDDHALLKDLRHHADSVRPGAVLIGEANLPTEEQPAYFGDGDELQVLFDYTLNAGVILALATEQAWPIRRALNRPAPHPHRCQWLSFLRLHDELSLERLSGDERQLVFDRWAPKPDDQLYGRGLRRRLPPMLDDPRRLRLALSLLFSLPGAPCLLWGEEIGMGDNSALPGRLAARTPMQWTSGPSAGFSSAPPGRLVRPLVEQEGYGPAWCNVADQRLDPRSLLSFVRRLIALRRAMPHIADGCELRADVPEPLLVHRCEGRGRGVLALHNLSGETARFPLAVPDGLRDLFTGEVVSGPLSLGPYGFRWLGGRLDEAGSGRRGR